MDFKIETMEMQYVSKMLGLVAAQGTTEPSGRVLIETTDDGKVVFIANNYEKEIAVTYTTDKVLINTAGSMSIPYKNIKSFVASFVPWVEDDGVGHGTKEFRLFKKDSSIFITASSKYQNGKRSTGKLKLNSFDPFDMFKPISFSAPTFVLNGGIFRTAVDKVSYSIDPNETREFIQGMNIDFQSEDICFVGCNGLLLSTYKIKNISKLNEVNHVLKPAFVNCVRRIITDESQIFFDIDDDRVIAKFDDVEVHGRTVVGSQYPDYASAFKTVTNSISVDKEILWNNILPIKDSLDSDDNNRLTMEIKDGNMRVYNDFADFDCGDVSYEGEFVADVNGEFVLQTLKSIKDDKITIEFSNEDGCIVFDSANFNDQAALVTPVRRR